MGKGKGMMYMGMFGNRYPNASKMPNTAPEAPTVMKSL